MNDNDALDQAEDGVARLVDSQRLLRIALWLTVGIAGLRVGIVLINYNIDSTRAFADDSNGYLGPALELARHFAYHIPGTSIPEYARTPGYPAFLAILLRVSGEDLWLPLTIQAALSALSIPLMMATARRLGVGLRWCVLVGVIIAFEPFQIATSGRVMTESLAAVLLALCAYVAVRMVQANFSWRWGLLFGATLAANTYVRPTTFYFPLLAGALFAFAALRRRREARHVLLTGAACLLLAITLVGIWNVRNVVETGSWRLSASEATTLYWYRAGGIIADRDHIPWDPDVRVLLTQRLNPGMSHEDALRYRQGDLPPAWEHRQGEYYDRATAKALAVFKAEPALFVKQTIRGVYSQLVSSGWESSAEVFGLAPLPAAVLGVSVALLLMFDLLAMIGAGWSLTLGPQRQASLWVAAILAYVILANAGYQAVAGHRFRAQVFPLLTLFAVMGASFVVERWSSSAHRRDRAGTR